MRLVDTHSHFDVDAFDIDRAQTLQRAKDEGVVAQIVPAIDAAGWPRLREVCAEDAGLHAAYGLHPIYLPQHRPEHLLALRAQLEQERCVAVGEIGLDYFIEDLDRERQQHYFEAQLELAREFELPVIVHGRRAFDAVIATLRRFMPLHGVVHSFAGSEEQAEQLYKLGFMLGIGGPVTYERAQRLRRLVAAMPIEHLLLETDSPDQPDSQWRGQRNEPVRLPVVLEAIAELRGESPETIAQATTANAERLFGIVAG
ncbi:DNAase [Lysobacter oculi]|uniref:DNAase n=1 Tax=Solilutibacter oculi TaxID=2698682 RepID=A0A344J4Y0_9GAMM|nr:TatD family hydrolase [Lysobacter oculi]AXA84090.1 DNAase [Lysobacter oculi]